MALAAVLLPSLTTFTEYISINGIVNELARTGP